MFSSDKRQEVIILNLVCLNLIQIILCFTIFVLMTSCAVPPEDCNKVQLEGEWPPKWVKASTFLPREKLQGLVHAGFFELKEGLYSHHCDSHGNLIRMKYDEENTLWKQVRYETHGCGGPDA